MSLSVVPSLSLVHDLNNEVRALFFNRTKDIAGDKGKRNAPIVKKFFFTTVMRRKVIRAIYDIKITRWCATQECVTFGNVQMLDSYAIRFNTIAK